jgi:hypothetical protein
MSFPIHIIVYMYAKKLNSVNVFYLFTRMFYFYINSIFTFVTANTFVLAFSKHVDSFDIESDFSSIIPNS